MDLFRKTLKPVEQVLKDSGVKTDDIAEVHSALYTRSNPPRTGLSGLLSSNSLNLPFNQAVDPVLLDIPHYPADYCMEYSCYTQAFSMFLLRVVSDSTQPRPFQLGRFLANQPSASCQISSCLSHLVSPRLASLTVDSPDQHIILSLIPSLVLSRLVSC